MKDDNGLGGLFAIIMIVIGIIATIATIPTFFYFLILIGCWKIIEDAYRDIKAKKYKDGLRVLSLLIIMMLLAVMVCFIREYVDLRIDLRRIV